MTKKDYKLIASAIATMPNQAHRDVAARALAGALTRENANFQTDLFLAACSLQLARP